MTNFEGVDDAARDLTEPCHHRSHSLDVTERASLPPTPSLRAAHSTSCLHTSVTHPQPSRTQGLRGADPSAATAVYSPSETRHATLPSPCSRHIISNKSAVNSPIPLDITKHMARLENIEMTMMDFVKNTDGLDAFSHTHFSGNNNLNQYKVGHTISLMQ